MDPRDFPQSGIVDNVIYIVPLLVLLSGEFLLQKHTR